MSIELSSVFQKRNEDIQTYGTQVENLLFEYIDTCISQAGASSERYVESLNELTALTSFQEGLTQEFRLLVKTYRCNTLKEAISKAC